MASSTIIPNTRIKPNMDKILSVTPENCMRINAPKKAIGNPIAAKKADLKSRNRAKIIRTITSPIVPLLTIVLNLSWTQ